MNSTITPTFSSLALADLPAPDYAEVQIYPLPPGSSTDPGWWAEAVFSAQMPVAVRALMGLRQALVPLLGLRPSTGDTFAVREVVGQEALISADEEHLDFRCAVGVDPTARLLRITTVVRLHGRRGRLYFGVVRLAHPQVLRALVLSAIRRSRHP